MLALSRWRSQPSLTLQRWPVIIAIIIASLIVLSVVSCLVRCLCCGLECCCGIFACCNACCPSPRGYSGRGRSARYADDPPPQKFQPSPYTGYQAPPSQPVYNPPPQQYAQFDATRKGANGNALPAMPTYGNATSKRVVDDTEEDVEMNNLDPHHEQKAPLVANQAPSPVGGHNRRERLDELPYQQHANDFGGDLGNPYGRGAASESSVYPSSSLLPGVPNNSNPQLYSNNNASRSFTGSPPRAYNGVAAQPYSSNGPPAYNSNAPSSLRPGYQNSAPAYQQPAYQQPTYSAYTPSESTRYEPSSVGQQETGTTYDQSPPAGPQHSNSFANQPAAPPQQRRPLQNTWREV